MIMEHPESGAVTVEPIICGIKREIEPLRWGYAVFGKVISGMPVVKRILKSKTWPGGEAAMKGQIIKDPVKIIEAKRV